MLNKSRNKAVIVSFITLIIGLIFCMFSIKITKLLPVSIISIMLLAYLYLYVIPFFNRAYMAMWRENNDEVVKFEWFDFAPFINELRILNSKIRYCCYILLTLTILCFIGMIIKPEFYNSLFGQNVALHFPNMFKKLWFNSFCIYNLVIGLGYLQVVRYVHWTYEKAYLTVGRTDDTSIKVVGWLLRNIPILEYIVLFIPLIRVLTLIYLQERVEQLERDFYTVYNVEEDEDEYNWNRNYEEEQYDSY